jgi:uncharacterized protein (DUF1330 family)
MALYALNLFDLADNDLYRRYSRRSAWAVGKLVGAEGGDPGTEPRTAMILVEWPSREAFDAFLNDPDNQDLHPLREGGTENYLWWTYERLEDLRPLLRETRGGS